MEEKNNVEFIVCPVCGMKNQMGQEYCNNCGCGLKKVAAQMAAQSSESTDNGQKSGVAFKSIDDEARTASTPKTKYKAPPTVFAEGLPDWDIVPPQILVKRR